MARVIIIGGGIAGRAAGVHLKTGAKAHGKAVDVLLLERDQRIGGKILTEKIGYCLVEAGPDSFLPEKVWTVNLVGSVIGSTATTKLALGLLKPSISSIRKHSQQIFSAWLASLILFVILAAISLPVNGIFTLAAFSNLVLLLLITNLIAVGAIALVSYAVAIVTFQKGLDPDNFVIPIESSLADSLTSIALLIALTLVV